MAAVKAGAIYYTRYDGVLVYADVRDCSTVMGHLTRKDIVLALEDSVNYWGETLRVLTRFGAGFLQRVNIDTG